MGTERDVQENVYDSATAHDIIDTAITNWIDANPDGDISSASIDQIMAYNVDFNWDYLVNRANSLNRGDERLISFNYRWGNYYNRSIGTQSVFGRLPESVDENGNPVVSDYGAPEGSTTLPALLETFYNSEEYRRMHNRTGNAETDTITGWYQPKSDTYAWQGRAGHAGFIPIYSNQASINQIKFKEAWQRRSRTGTDGGAGLNAATGGMTVRKDGEAIDSNYERVINKTDGTALRFDANGNQDDNGEYRIYYSTGKHSGGGLAGWIDDRLGTNFEHELEENSHTWVHRVSGYLLDQTTGNTGTTLLAGEDYHRDTTLAEASKVLGSEDANKHFDYYWDRSARVGAAIGDIWAHGAASATLTAAQAARSQEQGRDVDWGNVAVSVVASLAAGRIGGGGGQVSTGNAVGNMATRAAIRGASRGIQSGDISEGVETAFWNFANQYIGDSEAGWAGTTALSAARYASGDITEEQFWTSLGTSALGRGIRGWQNGDNNDNQSSSTSTRRSNTNALTGFQGGYQGTSLQGTQVGNRY